MYFTATFPYIMLLVLVVRGLTLDGAGDGIRFYLSPNMTVLSSFDVRAHMRTHRAVGVQVWRDAAVQMFYSLGLGYGSLITFGSYNQFTNLCWRDALIVAAV